MSHTAAEIERKRRALPHRQRQSVGHQRQQSGDEQENGG